MFDKPAGAVFTDTTVTLTGLLDARPDGKQTLRLSLFAGGRGAGAPAFYDPLPAGLEAVDLSLKTAGLPRVPAMSTADEESADQAEVTGWYYGRWEYGWWSPWDHRERRDDRVVYVATTLWPETYSVSYVARATTPGVFIRPPAHAEEMYNPAVNDRSDGGVFTGMSKR